MKDFMNNPMMDMFKKSFENPLTNSLQNFDMTKIFNPASWMEMSNKMTEHMPWLHALKSQNGSHPENAFNFAEKIEGMDLFSDLGHLSFENTQAMMRRQAEIIQKHSEEMHKFMQNMSPTNNPETNMNLQGSFMRSSFESLVNDFKELSEMYSKANLETFDAASKKVSQHIDKCCNSKESFSTKDTKSEQPKPKAKK